MLGIIITSAIVTLLSIGVLILSRNKKSEWKILPIVLIIISVAFGLLFCPLVFVNDHQDVIELKNYDVIKAKNGLILDLVNTDFSSGYPEGNLRKFNSYRAVTEYSDSTKFFVVIEKSFYGINLITEYTWSNPPYDKFNKE